MDPSIPPKPSIPPPPSIPMPVPPSVPMPVVQVQSLTPTGGTGTIHVVAPTASSAVPRPSVAHEVGSLEDQGEPVYVHEPLPPPPKRNILVEYWRKVGAGSFLLSILIHVGLFALAAAIVLPQLLVKQPVDFLPGGGSKSGQEASQQLAQNVKNKKRSTLNKQTPMKKVVSTSTTSNIALPEVPMDSIDMPEMSSLLGGAMGSGGFGTAGAGGGFGKGIGIGGQAGFVSLPPSMKARCSSAERLQKLRESGVSGECERAVSSALGYLKTVQNKDGSWGQGAGNAQDTGAMTGFALLCYLGRCETPESPFYGDTVMKGILYLIELGKKNEDGIFSEKPQTSHATYEHGIATYALGEMYTLARMGSKSLPGMREAFEKGVRTIIKYQTPLGAWAYGGETAGYRTSGEDLSVTGWQYQALKAAKLTNLKIPELYTTIDKTVKYLDSKQTKDGGYGNSNREKGYNQWTLTGVGVLGMQTLAHGKANEWKKGVKFAYEFLKAEPPKWQNPNLYSWYYWAQIFFQNGGEEMKYWNDTALPLILAAQDKKGGWGGGVYPTSLCTLMLEVYYRYLKVGDREQGSLFDR